MPPREQARPQGAGFLSSTPAPLSFSLSSPFLLISRRTGLISPGRKQRQILGAAGLTRHQRTGGEQGG
uniref:Uncharacterized protein n=1 Tax=Zea mays TaxID=4577 RepID=B8A3J5_MAIZE|nr:unknown [Zea mays]